MTRVLGCAILALLILSGCSCSHSISKLDPQSAVGGNDLTTLVSGCGQNITVGYLVCRLTEGTETANEYIFVHAPPNLHCRDERACVYFRIYFPDGRPTFEGAVKKGESFAQVPWSELTDKSLLDVSDRGFYGVSVTVNFTGPQGEAMKTYSDGYLFLHVTKRTPPYTSLLESEEDQYFVWQWKEERTNQVIKMTTGGRVYVSEPYFRDSFWGSASK